MTLFQYCLSELCHLLVVDCEKITISQVRYSSWSMTWLINKPYIGDPIGIGLFFKTFSVFHIEYLYCQKLTKQINFNSLVS